MWRVWPGREAGDGARDLVHSRGRHCYWQGVGGLRQIIALILFRRGGGDLYQRAARVLRQLHLQGRIERQAWPSRGGLWLESGQEGRQGGRLGLGGDQSLQCREGQGRGEGAAFTLQSYQSRYMCLSAQFSPPNFLRSSILRSSAWIDSYFVLAVNTEDISAGWACDWVVVSILGFYE